MKLSDIVVKIEKDYASAKTLVAEGYIPIEGSYGQETLHDLTRSNPILTLDHHGPFSDLPCPAHRARKEFLGQGNGRYVLSHIDNDAALTLLGLEGYEIPSNILNKVVYIDLSGWHKISEDEIYDSDYLKVRLMAEVCRLQEPVKNILSTILEIIEYEDAHPALVELAIKEQQRRADVMKDTTLLLDNNVAVFVSEKYGMDVLYAKSPIVVAFDSVKKSITIGCVDEETGRKLLGEKILEALWPLLGNGWGGRATIGGSPRGKEMNGHDLSFVLEKLRLLLDNRNKIHQKVNFDYRYLGALDQELKVLSFIKEIP